MSFKNDKIVSQLKKLEELLRFENEEDRIDVKASFIQLDILAEIKNLMTEKNISRTELAEKLKKSKSFVSQLFSGDKALNLKMIAQFQEIFDAKFIPSFKDYSEYTLEKQISKKNFLKSSKEEGWEKITPIIDIKTKQIIGWLEAA
ncbi:MAG: helix-turn-helix transcriptional regulator [Bacteroidetes bacterium]|nr:helix-turn-helix transcriptional regulator [Bacteroidota bacterium]